MLVAALFYDFQLHLQLADEEVGFSVFNGLDLAVAVCDGSDLNIIQVHHMLGLFDDSRGIEG